MWVTRFALLSFCSAAFATSLCAGYNVYVSNEISGDVSVIDGDTLAVVKTFPIGKRPRGIELSPDGRLALVAVSGSPRMGPGADPERAREMKADKAADGIAIADCATGKLERKLFVGSDPEEFALSADGRHLFVANEDTGECSAWEIASGRRLWKASVAEEPEGVALNPRAHEALVTSEAGGDITILDTETGTRLGQIVLGARPRSIAVKSDGSQAVVALEADGAIAVIDLSARRLAKTIKLQPAPALPMGVVYSPDQRRVFVTTGRGGKLAAVDLESGQTTMIAVGKRPWGIALSPDGKRLFTANGPSNDVSVVEVETLREIARIKVGEGPWGVTLGQK